ncbi:dihydrolipoamide acetyltransferase family protein [Metabacillus rhizolycopersici]|uniref:Dihydrolipoamide acetyltransferase component of pyruvate dehydrogenase complex n=1 Tax=Metabacillus rhizolycopersici TaxID=2875709 RepID=A0ABS7URD4_9BACI|nr:dihydrolipoamide acetyltransferase family protein [Metabacillus rhizolycopersici]MBZ5750474.1 2-oxo acid dehydrogenase subunit E2 [Metabacillus rhizolycopersici]
MAIEKIIMPQLGESVTEGTISKWLVSIGDKVNKYDPLAEVTTDKVNAEVPSSFSGVIKEILAEEGTTLAVGEAICTIEVAGVSGVEAVVETNNRPAKQELEKINKEEQPNKKRYSPAVLRISQENDIDLEQVNGTGAGGRITRKDLLQLIESGSIPKVGAIKQDVTEEIVSTITRAEIEKVKQLQPLAPPSTVPGDIEIPVTGVRKAIAANMVRSRTEIPHAWMMMEVDVTNLVEYRNSVKEGFKKKEGFNLTFFAFFVKAVAQVLKEFPQINSMWAEDKIIQKKDINISIAVAADDSLFVPVIKAADEKTVKGIAREITELAKKARSGKLVSADMQGGTFTLNNTGAFGSVQSMGIINHPQAAILQVESIVKRPVIINNAIAVRDMVNLCLSIDHRVLDGFISGLFLARVKEILENTSKETTSIY